METFALYLIKSSVWLTGFSLIYILFLRNERFFVLNRIYLVSGILVSIIFPLFTWHYTVIFPVTPTAEVLEPQVVGVTPVSDSFPIQNLLLYFYLTGALYLLFRLIKQTVAVWRVIRQSETQHFNSIKLIRTDRYPASFSFFSFVFVNPSIDEPETSEIVNHEQEHIRQQHWMDLLLFEILRTMHWFNPVSWLYGRLIRQNHEYLADERALQRSSNPAIYRAALLNQMFGGPVISLANSFNYSLNKKRFNMMKQITYSPFRKLKLLLVLPLIAGVFYAFATPEYKFAKTEDESGKTEATQITNEVIPAFTEANVIQNSEIENTIPMIITENETHSPQKQSIAGSLTTLTKEDKTIKGKVVDEQNNPLKGANIVISGTTIGTISDASGNFELKTANESLLVISYVGYMTIKKKPDFNKEMIIPMEPVTVGIGGVGNFIAESKSPEKPNPSLIFIDGKESSEKEMVQIDPEKIEKVIVLKGKQAIEKYGKKGKDGVVLVTLKKDDPASVSQTFKVKSNSPLKFGNTNSFGKQPLIIVDGVIEMQDVNNIPPETIESINVLKKESLTKIYGDKGKNGVILITTKKGASTKKNAPIDVKVTGYANDQKEKSSELTNTDVQIRSTGTSKIEGKPLIVKDGIIAENQEVEDIEPGTIESMNVLKGKVAIKKYGKKGKDGVIEFTMKKQGNTFMAVEEMPEFPGGVKALREYLNANFNYPAAAIEKGISGKVFVNFIVSKTGAVTNVKIFNGIDPILDNEAIRLVKTLPNWKPGKQNGEPVDVIYNIPVEFNLPQKK